MVSVGVQNVRRGVVMDKKTFQKIHQETSLEILENHYKVKGKQAVAEKISRDNDMPFIIKFEFKSLMKSIKEWGCLV